MKFRLIFYILSIKHNKICCACLLEDLLLISGSDRLEGEVFCVWSTQIPRGAMAFKR